MVAFADKYLCKGMYTLKEAAMYARVPQRTMSRWVFGSGGEPVIKPSYGKDDQYISFLDFIQTLAVRAIRTQHNVPLPKIRQALDYAQRKYGMEYPFAMDHVTYLHHDEIVIRPPNSSEDFVQASGKQQGQKFLPIVELYLKDLTFDDQGLARRYIAYQAPAGVEITMNPEERFGEPLLPSKYTSRTIAAAVPIEGGIEPTAEAYGIPVEEVEAAFRYHNDFLTIATK